MDVRDVIKALTTVINAKYPASQVSNKEIKSADYPCFKIKLIVGRKQRIAEGYTQKTISFDLVYFAESHYKGYLDLLSKQTELETLFDNPLKVDDSYLDIDELEFNLDEDNYILHTLFNVVISEYTEINSVDDDNDELMEYLEIGE